MASIAWPGGRYTRPRRPCKVFRMIEAASSAPSKEATVDEPVAKGIKEVAPAFSSVWTEAFRAVMVE